MSTQPTGLLPSPYLVCQSWEGSSLASVNFGVAAYISANRALYVPLRLPTTQVLVSVGVWCTTTGSGTFDLGLYDQLGTTRLGSLGSTSLAASSINLWTPATPILLEGGRLYFLAMSCSTISATFARQAISVLYENKLMGMAQEVAAHPLPATATPVTMNAIYCPAFSLTFR